MAKAIRGKPDRDILVCRHLMKLTDELVCNDGWKNMDDDTLRELDKVCSNIAATARRYIYVRFDQKLSAYETHRKRRTK